MKLILPVAALTAVLSINSSKAQNSCFTSLSDFSFTSPGNIRCMDKGDFNNDGHEDLILGAYVTAASNQMNFLAGNGSGGFAASVQFTASQRPQSIKAADYNGDGNLDVACVSNNLNFLVINFGSGTGTFSAPTTYSTNAGPTGVETADFNGDSVLDIVISFQGSGGGMQYFQGIAGGTFAAPVAYTMGTAPRSITVNDFNNDGNIDVAVANNSSANISVRLGNGDGTFGVNTNFATSSGGPFNIKSGFINSDANVDIVVSNSTGGTVSVFSGDGFGSFAATDNYSTGTGPNMVAIVDMDENGSNDIVVVNNSENTVSILKGTGSDAAGTVLMAQVKFPVIGTPQTFEEGDYNEDGHFDLAIPPVVGTRLLVMPGDGNGNLNTGANITTDSGPNGIAMGEFNGDANSDLVVANRTSNTISFFAGNGDGTYAVGVDFADVTAPTGIIAVDVNGDGDLDVVTANASSNTIGVLLGNGSGSFAAATYFATGGTTSSSLAAGDLDGDLDLDIITANEGSNNASVLLGDGTGNFGAATLFAVGTTPKSIAIAQLDINDSFLDFVTANSASNNLTVWNGNGAGGFIVSANYSSASNPVSVTTADLNSDGRNDLIAACGVPSRVSRLLANGTSTFAAAANYFTDALPQSVIAADFNNDGRIDVATANRVAVGSAGSVSVLMGNGTGALGTRTDFTTSNNSIALAVGNIDAGTYVDLAVANFDAANVSILLNRTATATALSATTFCEGGSVDLEANDGYSYLWSSGETTQTANITTSGTYSVTITNQSGLCSSQSTSITVTVNPAPEVIGITGDTTLCSAGSTSLVSIGSSGTVDMSWFDAPVLGTQVSPDENFTTPVLASTTTYYVDAVDNVTGCTIASMYPVTIVVGDSEDPIINSMPANIVISAGISCDTIVTWSAPSATDNCGLLSLNPNISSGSTFPIGVTTVTYTALDNASNSSNASFTVTVEDNTDPIISSVPSTINAVAVTGTCAQTVSWSIPGATDNCTLASFTSTHNPGDSFNVGTTTVTYTATDSEGNSSTASFDVIVADNELPVITGVSVDTTITVTAGTCGAVYNWFAANATDNCGILTFTESDTSGTVFPVGTTTINYLAVDVNGNVSNASFDVTVVDNELPVISSMPIDTTIGSDVGECGGTYTWTLPIASDNCTVTSFISTDSIGTLFPVGTTTVTYIATDASGNVQTASFDVTVVDDLLPSFSSFPSNISMGSTIGLCGANVTWTLPVGDDNCGIASMTSSDTSGSFFGTGTNIVSYTLTDLSGNSINQSFTITIVDIEAPVMTGCPSTITACQGDTVTYTPPTATDNCSGMTLTQIAGLPSGSVFPVGTTLCTYRATDGAGNLVNCNFNVIVNAKPNVIFNLAVDSLCNTDLAYVLTEATPSGGIYSGTGVAAGQFDPATTGPGTYEITYTFTNAQGCTDAEVDSVVVDDCSSVNEVDMNSFIQVFPNPSSGQFTLTMSTGIEIMDLSIYNNYGARVHQQKTSGTSTSIDLNFLANGIYYLRIEGTSAKPIKLVIQR